MVNQSIDIELGEIQIGNEIIQSPYPVKHHRIDQEKVYVIIQTVTRNQFENPDFQVPSDGRNVVAFDYQGNLEWFIEPVSSSGADAHHLNFLLRTERYVTRHTGGNVQFDPATGEVLKVFPKNQLPIGSERVEFSGEVFRVLTFEDGIFVKCRDGDRDLYAFERDGTERWRSGVGNRRGHLSVEDGDLWEQLAADRTTDYRYRVDPETGERLSKEEIDTGLW